MPVVDPASRREATALFKRAVKVNSAAIHRTLNRPPKGRGWVQCVNSPPGILCRPERVRESIELFTRAYRTYPDIVALNQIALAHEMLGELEAAREHFIRMREQALGEGIPAYVRAAELGLARLRRRDRAVQHLAAHRLVAAGIACCNERASSSVRRQRIRRFPLRQDGRLRMGSNSHVARRRRASRIAVCTPIAALAHEPFRA